MRRILSTAVLFALLAIAAPVNAQVASATSLPACTDVGESVVVTRNGLRTGIATPTQPLYNATGAPGTLKTFVLDLSGGGTTNSRAMVNVTMTWNIPVEDYDLNLLDERGARLDHSENLQPYVTGENVSSELRHCQKFHVEAMNYMAAGLSDLQLDLAVTPLSGR